jgi:hypothetical protein
MPAVEPLAQPGVRHHQVAAVQHVVRDQAVHELRRRRDELRRPGAQLLERLGQPVRPPHVAATQRPDQLVLVVARHRQRHPVGDHAHRQAQHSGRVRAAVDQVAEEHRGAPGRVVRGDRRPVGVPDQPPAQLVQQRGELTEAAVYIADQVERPGVPAQVVVRRRPHDGGLLDLLGAGQHVHRAEPLGLELAQAAPQLTVLAPDHLRAEPRARRAQLLRQVQHDRHRQHVVLAGQCDQPGAGGALGVRRVDDGQPTPAQPDTGQVVQRVERVGGGLLAVRVVADQAAEGIRGEHLGRREMPCREGGLTGPAGADQQHQGQLRDAQLARGTHAATPRVADRVNTASWVGVPSTGSGAPMPSWRTR